MNEIFIKNIEIKDLRHLKNINIFLDGSKRSHLIITGKNGAGKTSLLESIKKYLLLGIENKMLRSDKLNLNTIENKKNELAEHIQHLKVNRITLGNDDIAKQERKIAKLKKELNKEESEIKPFLEINIEFNKSIVTVCEEYSNDELIFILFEDFRSVKDIDILNHIIKQEIPEKKSIDENLSKLFHNYLARLKVDEIVAQNKQDFEKANAIKAWFKKLEERFASIFNDPSLKIDFDDTTYQLIFLQNNRNPVNFKELSAGFSAILKIIAELIMRTGGIASLTNSLQGIILIDEVETHLHPELEKEILPFLIDFFPSFQFIVTTHSPIVAASIPNAILFDLETQNKIRDSYFLSYSTLIENHFNLKHNHSQNLQNKLDRFSYLVGQTETSQDIDENEKEEIKNLIDELDKFAPTFEGHTFFKYKKTKEKLLNLR